MTNFQENRWIYSFVEAKSLSRKVIGNKAFGVSSLISWGLPVPEGIVLDVKVCRYFLENQDLPSQVWDSIKKSVSKLGWNSNQKGLPVLLAVRSGASISMPGMMDSILNVGLNDQTLSRMAEHSGDPRFAYHAYISFLDQYIRLILQVSRRELARLYRPFLRKEKVEHWEELSLASLSQIKELLFQQYSLHAPEVFPQDAWEQLKQAIITIFHSWNNTRAVQFRKEKGIDHHLGTAVIIMPMVHPTLDKDSGSGVIVTRNPDNGERTIVGEYLPGKYGLGMVGGTIQPDDISVLKEQQPAVFAQLQLIAEKIESETGQIQEIEFVIQSTKLWLLQTRNAISSMTAEYALVQDLVKSGKISEQEAETRIDWDQMKSERKSYFDPSVLKHAQLIGTGIPASPNVAVGRICFSMESLGSADEEGPKLLIREYTKPDDVKGIVNAAGIVTLTGGRMSHAAVIARIFRKPCIVGCQDWKIKISNGKAFLHTGSLILEEGAMISIDGNSGRIYAGKLAISTSSV